MTLKNEIVPNSTGYNLIGEIPGSKYPEELILVGASAREIKRKAVEEGMITLRSSGLNKIRAGTTTLEEVLRETVLN